MWRARRNGLFTRTTDTNLDYAFVKNALVLIVPKIWRVPGPLRPRLPLSYVRTEISERDIPIDDTLR